MAEQEEQQSTEQALSDLPLLERVIRQGRMAVDPGQVDYAQDLVGEFANQILEEGMTVKDDTLETIEARIAEIDNLLTDQLNEIMHNAEFQKLEANWRSVHRLVKNTETSETLKLRLLSVARNDLQRDLEKASEFDQSVLFKKVYEEEFGTPGGQPYGLLLSDIEFGRHPKDVALLEMISGVAAAAHAPFLASAGPKMFDMESYTELGDPRDLAKIFESSELIDWRAFRETDDARYVSLTLPRALVRLPYGPDTLPVEEFDFQEDVDGTDHDKYLWGSSAYHLAERITNAFALYGWCGAIRGVEGGGKVEGLPAHTFQTVDGDIGLKCPTEVAITDRRENELDKLGLIAMCHYKGDNFAAFFGGRTTQKPKKFDLDAANDNAQLSTIMPYILAASRFAHYLKVICRDKVGSFQTAEVLSTYLNRWINNYVLETDEAGQDLKAQYPLREARIDVTEVPGKPGTYRAIAFLRPHFQLEALTTSIRLVAELPPPAVA